MEPGAEGAPGWHGSAPYRALLGIDQAGLAWEWLRRDPTYATCVARGSPRVPPEDDVREDPAALPWGLHFRGGSKPFRA